MRSQTPRWSLLQASQVAGVTRSSARAVLAEGLVGPAPLTDADVVALRALTSVRTLTFPGEVTPANKARTIHQREYQLVAVINELVNSHATDSSVLCFPDRSVAVTGYLELTIELASAHRAGQPFLLLPVGAWITELAGTRAPQAVEDSENFAESPGAHPAGGLRRRDRVAPAEPPRAQPIQDPAPAPNPGEVGPGRAASSA